MGDVLSGRHGADHSGRAPDADLRNGCDGNRRLAAVAVAASVAARNAVRSLSRPRRHRAIAGGVHPQEQRGTRRPDGAAASEHRDDRGHERT